MSAPIPIVRKLQADALDLNVPVSGLLRTVKLIAAKLDLKEQLIDAHILVLFELLAGSLIQVVNRRHFTLSSPEWPVASAAQRPPI